MTREAKINVAVWLPVALGLLTIASAIWGGASRMQHLEDKAETNKANIHRIETDLVKRLDRMESKLDLLTAARR